MVGGQPCQDLGARNGPIRTHAPGLRLVGSPIVRTPSLRRRAVVRHNVEARLPSDDATLHVPCEDQVRSKGDGAPTAVITATPLLGA